ncbi:gamma-glutamyltransferase family protein [Emcibacter sp.]|uniref:gamma-glutamyltransferase family protein n=1 Tax=Emcibacter sp. TaxID=1979954 RepID=UPI002AA73755|nr:gamma-glutamyltransferase family protein [Emcibacter sp.]
MGNRSIFFSVIVSINLLFVSACTADEQKQFAGAVSSASPEATAAGIEILEKGGNAIDAAIAVSLALGVSEPAGSGIGGQTVMLVHPGKGGKPFVIHGTTWSPRHLPENITKEQLQYGRTASSVPSTPKVLDLAFHKYGSGEVEWKELVAPAVHLARDGFTVGPFRQKAFRFYGDGLKKQETAREIFTKPDGTAYQVGEVVRQKKLAKMLERIAKVGAEDFYTGQIAKGIARDMKENGGWITEEDLAKFPEPRIVEPLISSYRGHDVASLPPPFGGWVMIQILNILEQMEPANLDQDDEQRRLGLMDAMKLAHGSRKNDPVQSFTDYADDINRKISKEEAAKLLAAWRDQTGGETTHFSVVDGNGMAVAVTQSIDSYFGSKVAHPEYGFLYNNYMQGFRLKDDGSPYVLKPFEMPYSSMSATILSRNGEAELVLGSPGSARIISAVAQVASHWVDVNAGVEAAVGAFRVHVIPDNKAYVEGPEIGTELLRGMAKRGFVLKRPKYGVSDSQYDPYFGGVHALALENNQWTGAADPRRDGLVGIAWKQKQPGEQ